MYRVKHICSREESSLYKRLFRLLYRKTLYLPDGTYYDKIIVPVIMALEAEKYGFRYVNEFQTLKEDMHLFPDEYFTHPSKQTENIICSSYGEK